ncbi:MAG: hypothetical protein V4466_12005 [Pseudomonadota bacterium]
MAFSIGQLLRLVRQAKAPPVITSAPVVHVNEGAQLALALTASQPSTFTVTGGPDGGQVEISGTTLRWLANGVRSYDVPSDVGGDNVYNVQVTPRAIATGRVGPAQAISIIVDQVIIIGGAPVFANQTVAVGRLTRSGGTVADLTAINTPTSWSILSGDPSGHFAISNAGKITVTSAGQDALLASYALSVRATNASGHADHTITVNTEAGAFDVTSLAEMNAALALAQADLTATWKIYVKDGYTIAGQVLIQNQAWTASINDPNRGVSEASFDRTARPSFTGGGSLTITSRNGHGVLRGIDGVSTLGHCLYLTSVRGLLLDNLTFQRVSAATGNTAYKAVYLEKAAAGVAGTIIIRNCTFGAGGLGIASNSWANAIDLFEAEEGHVYDCTFDYYFKGIICRHLPRSTAMRNHFGANFSDDGIDYLLSGSAQPTTMTYPDRVCVATDNIMLPQAYLPELAAAHSDGIQFGAAADDRGYNVFWKWNYIGREQCIFCSSSTSAAAHVYGVIANNFLASSNRHTLDFCRVASGNTLEVRNNTVIKNSPSWQFDAGSAYYPAGANLQPNIAQSLRTQGDAPTLGTVLISNNITAQFRNYKTAQIYTSDAAVPASFSDGGIAPTMSANVYVSPFASSGQDIPACFHGPNAAPANPSNYAKVNNFLYETTNGTDKRWWWAWNVTDYAQFKADADTIFTPIGPAVGAGHLHAA